MSLKKKLEELSFYNSAVKPLHFFRAVFAAVGAGFPGKKLRVIGVTGTNGKTTTCFMIWKMLNEAGYKTGLMTTVAWGGVGKKKLHDELNHMTTVDSKTLNRRIKKIRDAGAKFLVLEVTSHAMEQFRTLGVPIEIAVWTNLTHEHLDYHKTIENYRKAKCKLFKKAKFGVINADDKSSRAFISASKDYITYGIKNGKMRAKDIKMGVFGSKYSCGDINVKVKIPGKFNIYNSLAAVCVGEKLGLSKEEIEKGIFALESVEGRMNLIDEGQDFSVIVDYAHTPDALEKVFEAIPEVSGRVISVHGGAGRRDESTRAERGEILGKNSDFVIITEDDSRDEDPEKIARKFIKGAEKAGKILGRDLAVDLDRESAIRAAIRLAKKGDLVLILGKGHEKTILRAEGPVEFEDTKVARKALREKVRAIEIRKEALEKARKAKELEALKKKKAELAKKKKAREKYGNTNW
ncbi:UDP-N-acetylmuramoyl-L-alanyl-D-glutamate--2,6-diaminopimelate ligase [Candidatus Saccharibacteria bacterium]|nr:UDP-N-acetylmuramoyl-L-alanyl-D-glutamate--2,6-diaminopimelate ligase [Candidatus Saccharibacteria bacterium]